MPTTTAFSIYTLDVHYTATLETMINYTGIQQQHFQFTFENKLYTSMKKMNFASKDPFTN